MCMCFNFVLLCEGGLLLLMLNNCFISLFCNQNGLGLTFAISGVGEESGNGRGWALLYCTATYSCANALL